MNPTSHKTLIPVILLGIAIASCAPASTVSVAESSLSRETNPVIAESDLHSLAGANNAFALDLYSSLREENGNLILSPYSISLALAMTYAGARAETESQMARTMHFSSRDQLHTAFNALDLALEKKPVNLDKDQEPMTLKIANAVWAEQTYPFQQDFLDLIALNYGAGVKLADFIHQAEPARQQINAWVSDQTEDRIKDLLPADSLDADTRMVLVNAIYFKADWLAKFDPNWTVDAPFYLLDGTQSSAKMMHEGMFGLPYSKIDGVQAVELAYAGQTTAMDVLLPDPGNFEAFEAALDQSVLDDILAGMQPASVELGLPKFDFSRDFSLPDALKSLGMTDAFDANLADFSGMTGTKDLYIGNVIHKAFVAVDEAGTEAAAATAVIMETTSAMMYDVTLQIDRPFIFIIRDTLSGQILFIGRVLNPAG